MERTSTSIKNCGIFFVAFAFRSLSFSLLTFPLLVGDVILWRRSPPLPGAVEVVEEEEEEEEEEEVLLLLLLLVVVVLLLQFCMLQVFAFARWTDQGMATATRGHWRRTLVTSALSRI